MQQSSTGKRLVISTLFAAICVAAGFFLATGFETPAKVTAQITTGTTANLTGTQLPLVDEEGNSPFVIVAEKVKPVVVNIQAERQAEGMSATPFDIFDWNPFFGRPPDPNSTRRVPKVVSGGSGIIIEASGYILTNNHVVAEATDIKVTFADGSERQAEIIGADPETDVALIKVDGILPKEMVANLGDSDAIKIGEWAIAIGNPFGLDRTVTVGVISARGRSNLHIGGGQGPSFQDFIQTDASINFGNSGGPLVNIHGEVIGVNTAINAQGQGIGFAIPINLARRIADQLKTNGEVKRGFLGVFPRELDEMTREALGYEPDVKGVFVESVQKGTPAEEGGLKGGEIITGIDGDDVKDLTAFRFKIADYPPGATVKMRVLQKGKEKNLKFKLADRAEFINLPVTEQIRPDTWLGISVKPTDGREGQQLGVDDINGVLVISIEPDSPGYGVIEPGDIIVEIAGAEILSVEDFNKVAEDLVERKRAIPFWIVRNGRRAFIPIRP